MKLWLDVHGLHARPLIQYVISPWLVNIWTCYGLLHSLTYSVPFPGLSLFLNSNWNASLTTVVFLKLPLTNHQIERQEEGVLSSLLLCVVCLYFMHLSMSSRRGEASIGRDFDIFPKIAVKFPTPGQKCEVKYTEIPHPRKWFVVTGTNNYYNIPTPGTAR